ncbi:MAG TPA: hypothetical protein VJB97_03520 [Candidatus Paceibacterota bacterium]
MVKFSLDWEHSGRKEIEVRINGTPVTPEGEAEFLGDLAFTEGCHAAACGNRKAAINAFEEALGYAPSHKDARAALGQLRGAAG